MVCRAMRAMPALPPHGPPHEVVQTQASLGNALFGHHHDQVLRVLRVGHHIGLGGVIDGPAAVAHAGLAAALLHLRMAAPGGHDLEIGRFTVAQTVAVAHDAVAPGIQLGEHDIACVGHAQMPVKTGVAIQIRLQPREQPRHPVLPGGRRFFLGKTIGTQYHGRGHGP